MNKPTHEAYLALQKRIEKIRLKKTKGYKMFYLERLREVVSFVSDYTRARLMTIENINKRRFSGRVDSTSGIDELSSPQYLHPDVMKGE